jgi:hypothetical protein
MSRQSPFGHPFLLGFDEIEQALDRVAKVANDGYPPYNIERLVRTEPSRSACASPWRSRASPEISSR